MALKFRIGDQRSVLVSEKNNVTTQFTLEQAIYGVLIYSKAVSFGGKTIEHTDLIIEMLEAKEKGVSNT